MAPQDKKPYDPTLAAAAVDEHVADFVAVVRDRLTALAERDGRPGLVVAAYDTELFGHWWHEGPAWLEGVLTALPAAGVRVTTLRGAVDAGHLGDPVDLPASSWGSGKDWRVWDGEQVADLVRAGSEVQQRLLSTVDTLFGGAAGSVVAPGRDAAANQLAREALLALSSDWAFMVTKDSAADYARGRAGTHGERFHRLADLLCAGEYDAARDYATRLRGADGLFGRLDARDLRGEPPTR